MIIFKRLWQEPLVHFLLIGCALFLLYGLQNESVVRNRITINEADIDRLSLLWEKKRQRQPTQQELQRMIEQQIREEVLYREALAMGLDQNDAVVRRRMVQKFDFISSDIAATIEPSDTELNMYLKQHPEKFTTAASLSFQHIYFSRDKRAEKMTTDALQLLNELKETDNKIDARVAGDPFMMGLQHENITEYGVSRLLGQAFAATLFTLSAGGWQGPVESEYGSHLVRIINKTDFKAAELSSVREKVRNEWQAEQRSNINETFYQSLKQRYEVVIENGLAADSPQGNSRLGKNSPGKGTSAKGASDGNAFEENNPEKIKREKIKLISRN